MPEEIFLGKGAVCKNSIVHQTVKIYKEAEVINCNLSEYTTIGNYSRVVDSTCAAHAQIGRNNTIISCAFGRYSYTGYYTICNDTTIGSFCSISYGVDIGGGTHNYNRLTTYPIYRELNSGVEDWFNSVPEPCIIGNDVWVGAEATIIGGVKVQTGAVIGAGSVVTHDVAPYAIVAGVPAKTIKYRFSDEIISDLLETRWWDLPSDVLKNNFNLLDTAPTTEVIKKIKELRDIYS